MNPEAEETEAVIKNSDDYDNARSEEPPQGFLELKLE
jgi:hypothetical protein